jgi:hypothetical protein
MSNTLTFDSIHIGSLFNSPSGIVYQKNSKVRATTMYDIDGVRITTGKTTSKFYKTDITVTKYVR